MDIVEFNTDSCVLSGGAYLASFRLLVEIVGVRTWHYYGTTIPGATINGVPAIQHDAVQVLFNTEELKSAAFSLASTMARDELSQ